MFKTRRMSISIAQANLDNADAYMKGYISPPGYCRRLAGRFYDDVVLCRLGSNMCIDLLMSSQPEVSNGRLRSRLSSEDQLRAAHIFMALTRYAGNIRACKILLASVDELTRLEELATTIRGVDATAAYCKDLRLTNLGGIGLGVIQRDHYSGKSWL